MTSDCSAVEYYFDLVDFAHRELFSGCTNVWEVLPRLPAYVDSRLDPAICGTVMEGAWVGPQVFLAPGCRVEPGALVRGPAIIGAGTVIRQGAYIREYCLIGEKCVVGHATEVKGSIMLNGSQAPHFNYVGDSVLGNRANLGAGTKLSNLKNDHGPVSVVVNGVRQCTGLRKLGAIVGDGVAIGCNCVTSPGSLIGPNSMVYANLVVRGTVPRDSIVKLYQEVEVVPRQGNPSISR